MAVLLLLGYAALCVAIFKILRIPLNQWTVTTASLGAVVIVGGLILALNFNHPFSARARLYFYTTPIIPTVSGQIVDVAVTPNEPIETGTSLFRIDPRPFQYQLDQRRAALAEAEQGVKELEASKNQAEAAAEKAKAEVTLAQETYRRQAELLSRDVVAQAAVDTATRNLEAAQQSLAAAEAAAERARLAFGSEIGGVNTSVAALQADVQSAEFNLEQSNVKAPSNGYVLQLFLRNGMTVGPGTNTMVFVDTDHPIFAAAFPQNVLSRLTVGQSAEVIFPSLPGRVFPARIDVLQAAIAQGQLSASGTLLAYDAGGPNDAIVRLALETDIPVTELLPGSSAQVAVYSDHLTAIAIIRKILLRMKSWLNYIVA
ncbi:efflux RND transporter periplasmic adaptor subunit [Acuticoccus sp. M5D2P5]|uniref:HlyD family secretion protein n=1 Tax=Acuticoccus kalidii TaxID=2910977 RepID=UPI001F2A0200|nr:efflux RND transporter periplasmic adaptor subunit [Acuticoccus kalidii]MCF3934816.1 efflux RND transporter periplasmic adaptor subunit [Acuticoccus kalidii]